MAESAEVTIANALNENDDVLESLATYIATESSTTVSGDTAGNSTGDQTLEEIVFSSMADGELGSGDLYAISVFTTKVETDSKVLNKAGFAQTENTKNNADMSIQR